MIREEDRVPVDKFIKSPVNKTAKKFWKEIGFNEPYLQVPVVHTRAQNSSNTAQNEAFK